MVVAERNLWIDELARDQGTYRKVTVFDDSDSRDPYPDRQFCNSNDMEEALVEALDAGLSAQEIADIQLGAIS